MKKILLLLLFFNGFLTSNLVLAAPVTGTTANIASNTELTELNLSSVEGFLNLTPRTIREATGKKMSIKEIIQLKTAQKVLKKGLATGQEEDLPQWLYIILAVFGFAWIIMGVRDDWSSTNFWVNISLTVGLFIIGFACPLLWFFATIPGLVHALIVMKEYY